MPDEGAAIQRGGVVLCRTRITNGETQCRPTKKSPRRPSLIPVVDRHATLGGAMVSSIDYLQISLNRQRRRGVAAGCMKTLRWCAGLRLQRKRPHKFLGAIEAVTVLSLICRCTARSRNGICLYHASGHATERTAPIDFRRLGSSVRNRATKAAAVAWIATHGSCEIA
jgi:hypothetical protein